MLMHIINVKHDIFKENRKLASKNKKMLNEKNVFAVNIMGAIGSGKTTLIEEAIKRLKRYNIAVIAGDVIAKMDAERFIKLGVKTVEANTGHECHLDAKIIEKSLKELNLDEIDVLFIENVGNLICPADYDLGEHKRIVAVSVSEGDDIVLKHPVIFKTVDLAIIHKIDIAKAVRADEKKMEKDAQMLNPNIPVLLTSTKNEKSMEKWIEYIISNLG
ncbi:MAG: hydrogenase nickel incorporation protein HypB [Methanosarcinaceae archaeon]|jgi:hydrogenase nickel incorporation protein HypB|nr:hydrogenase nickel incorporation protein HypB [Methanosarcinaceae archaeon]